MDLLLDGKVALIAASSRGLGRACAMRFASEGCNIAINGRDPETLATTAQQIRGETDARVLEIVADMSDPADITRMVDAAAEHYGGLDIVVANAGGPPPGYLSTLTEEDFLNAINTNLMGTIRMIRAAVPHLEARGGGSITTITSGGVKQPIGNLILSNTARPGVVGFVKSIADELAPKNIRVNNVGPGATNTDRIRETLERAIDQGIKEGKTEEQVMAEVAAPIPMRRLGEPEEFANVVVFLASPAAAYVTGATVVVDGGRSQPIL